MRLTGPSSRSPLSSSTHVPMTVIKRKGEEKGEEAVEGEKTGRKEEGNRLLTNHMMGRLSVHL